MPATANQVAAPDQVVDLSKERISSSIPKGGTESTWLYPSPQMVSILLIGLTFIFIILLLLFCIFIYYLYSFGMHLFVKTKLKVLQKKIWKMLYEFIII